MENFSEGKMSFAQSANLIISNFNLSLHSYNQTIDIDALIKNFEMDVQLNENQTMLLQNNKPVSKHNLKMNTKEHKRIHYERPTGFVQLQYARERKSDPTVSNIDKNSLISIPPIGPILDGAWCPSCLNVGPKFHKTNCKEPNSLKFTLWGIIQYIYDDKKLEQENLQDFLKALKDRIKFRIRSSNPTFDHYIQAYNDVLIQYPEMNRYKETAVRQQEGGWPLLNIDVEKKLSKGGGTFPNCVVIKYNFRESSVSVRIYDKGTILLISCPWEQKDFTNVLLDRINRTESVVDVGKIHNYEIDSSKTQVKSVFSIFHLNSDIDLDALFKYIWPLDKSGNPTDSGVKVTLTKRFELSGETQEHTYLKNRQTYYRYEVKYDKKIILTMLPTVLGEEAIPKYCKPYKISVIIFKGGAIELIFSFTKGDEMLSDSTEYIIPIDLKDQFTEIENELQEAKSFIEALILPKFRTQSDKVASSPINTVSGIFPYKKPLSYKPNTQVDIFDRDQMEFSDTGVVTKAIDETNYEIQTQSGDNKIISEQFIRPNGKKVSAMLLNDPPNNRPEPYGFRSKCPEGNNYIVPFGGKQGRDNYYYPVCKKATGPDRKLYLSQILDGFPSTAAEEKEFIISNTNEYDKFSGVFKTGAIKLFATIRFKLSPELLDEISEEAIEYFNSNADDEGYMEGKIVNFKKTSGNVLDNYVIYTVQMQNGELVYITGKDIHPSYKESRVWEGIQGNDEMKKQQLIRCTEKLGLSQSPFTTSRLHREMETKVVKKLRDLLGPENLFARQIAFTPQTMIKFTQRPYIGLSFPKGSKRVLFLIEGAKAYLIDESLAVMEVPIDTDIFIKMGDCVLEGFAYQNSRAVEFYPVDCIYLRKNLTVDYFSDAEPASPTASPTNEFFYDDLPLGVENLRKIEKLIDNLRYGRLVYTILIASLLMANPYDPRSHRAFKVNNPQDYCAPKCTNFEYLSENSMIRDLAVVTDNNEILFVPQKGRSSNIRWMKLINRPIVLLMVEVLKNSCRVGLDGKTFKEFEEVALSANMRNEIMKKAKQDRFMRFYLNFMSNGQLNPEEKLIVDNINPYATSREAQTYEKTDLIVKALLYPVPVTMFQNGKHWKIVTNTPDHTKIFSIHLESSPDSPGTSAFMRK
jgi:hypothetical protein